PDDLIPDYVPDTAMVGLEVEFSTEDVAPEGPRQGFEKAGPRQRIFFDPLHTRAGIVRSEEHTSELQSRENLVCRLLLVKKNANVLRNTDTSHALGDRPARATRLFLASWRSAQQLSRGRVAV